jgi:hypothetical protein
VPHYLPADWKPRDEDLQEATTLLGTQAAESAAREFIEHWGSVGGKAGMKSKWDTTFMNRVQAPAERGRDNVEDDLDEAILTVSAFTHQRANTGDCGVL